MYLHVFVRYKEKKGRDEWVPEVRCDATLVLRVVLGGAVWRYETPGTDVRAYGNARRCLWLRVVGSTRLVTMGLRVSSYWSARML